MHHGERRSYARGCHCLLCRAANAAYSSARRSTSSTPSSSTPADAARLHLAALAQLGIGIRQIARLTSVAPSTVAAVRSGRATTCRPAIAARLLAATATPAPGALVKATRAWRHIDSLRREGFTRREIAWQLGYHSQQLQLAPKRILARSAAHIARVYSRLAD